MTWQVNAIAQVAANNTQGALSFDDKDAASLILQSLKNYPQIRYAVTLDATGSIFSQYNNNWSVTTTPRVIDQHIFITSDFIEVSQPVIWDGELIGQVYLLSDTEQLKVRQLEFALIALVIFAVALLTTVLVTRRKVQAIIEPISKLVALFKEIGTHKDYSLRAKSTPIVELNTLVHGFNSMLEEMSVAELDLLKSEERLSLALLGGGEGLWDLDLSQNQLYLDQHSCHILALSQEEALLSNTQWHQMIHPDDLEQFQVYSKHYLTQQSEQYNIEFRVACNNSWLWLKLTGKITQFAQNNSPLRMTGTLQDITKEHLAEEQIKLYATVFDNTSDAIVILDYQFKVIAVNQAFSNITQFDANEMHNQQLSVIQDIENLVRH